MTKKVTKNNKEGLRKLSGSPVVVAWSQTNICEFYLNKETKETYFALEPLSLILNWFKDQKIDVIVDKYFECKKIRRKLSDNPEATKLNDYLKEDKIYEIPNN